jgi:hypothetical protein
MAVLGKPLAAPLAKARARSWVVSDSVSGAPSYSVEVAIGRVPSVV